MATLSSFVCVFVKRLEKYTSSQAQKHKKIGVNWGMCRETPPTYIDICVLYGLTLEKKRQKKDGLLYQFLVAGGVGFLWVGLCR
jgi:hypothetical protein